MPQQIVIAEQARIAALLKDDRVDELIVAQGQYQIDDIFLGTVENVLPGIDAAFIDIGESEKNGFIHVSDLGPLKLKKGAAGITELLEPRQKVLVQVMKEPTGTKGPRLTGNISLPGKYIVLQPFGQGVNISRKINAETERSRLRALGVLIKPPSTGLLFRTESENISEELLIDDLESLIQKWENIINISEANQPPMLISRDEDFALKILRDHLTNSTNRITIDNKNAIERSKNFIADNDSKVIVEFHNNLKDENILEKYKINQTIQKALQPRVDLPSGGYIIIEPTEALTVIDVNSGSFTRSANSRQTVLWTNCEAAIEISRQMKLRNIGGVLIIDFIDMDSRRDQFQLLEHFNTALKEDSSRPQIAQLTELGLVELTRKRQGQNIYELFGQKCSCCNGLGHIENLPDLQKIDLESKKSIPKKSKKSHEGFNDQSQIDQHEIRVKNIEKEFNNVSVTDDESTNIKKKESKDEISNNSNEKELISVELTKEEKFVFSQLGINPLIKKGKEYLNANNTAQLDTPENNNELSDEKKSKNSDSKNLKEEIDSKISNLEKTTIINEELTPKDFENKNSSDLDNTELNQEIDQSRRKRRRSSATDD
tara:strand:- start:3108 stop:4910 length:1803 start_codon:yes stop_codon:yes gene_type:complete